MKVSDLVWRFWHLKPGKTYRCRYPGHDRHYQDEVVAVNEGEWSRSVWLLHGHDIAVYYPQQELVVADDWGYRTNLTYSRLNAIFWRVGLSFFRVFLCGFFVYGFMRDHETDTYYLMPPGGLKIHLRTREVRQGDGDEMPLLRIPGYFFGEFEKTIRYLGRRYGLTLDRILSGDIPREVERRLRRRTKEKIGLIRLLGTEIPATAAR